MVYGSCQLGPFVIAVQMNISMGSFRTIFTLSPQVNFKQAFRTYSPARNNWTTYVVGDGTQQSIPLMQML